MEVGGVGSIPDSYFYPLFLIIFIIKKGNNKLTILII